MALNPTDIQKAYVAFFNRPADVAGLTYWSTYAGNSSDLLNTFAKSAEYNALYSGLNNTQLVNAIYQNLFGRSPEPTGLTYWVKELDTGKVTIGNAANTIQTAAQGSDKTTIDNKVAAATAFTTALDTTAEIVGYAGASSALQGQVKAWLSSVTDSAASLTAAQASLGALTDTIKGGTNEAGATYVLKTEQDILTGSNGDDFFRAVVGKQEGTQDQTTLNSSDIIDGGAGSDTLIVNMTGNYGGSARIKGIETLQIGTNQPTATFDYNVNAGANEVNDVNTVVYDQITTDETLNVINVTPTAKGGVIPTLVWANELNSVAGTIGVTYRQASIAGDASKPDNQNIVLKNVNNGQINIARGIETITIESAGDIAANTLSPSAGFDGFAADLVSESTVGNRVWDDSTLTKVIVKGEKAFGKVATVNTNDAARETGYGLTNRIDDGVSDIGNSTDAASASNLVSVAATVKEINAADANGGVAMRFTSRVDGNAVDVTFTGGKGADYIEFQRGNVSAAGGDGADTFAFVNSTPTNFDFGSADTITGGAGSDTIQLGVNGVGTVVANTTEFNNKTGIDVLDLRGAVNTVTLADAFVAGADAGTFTVRTDKIVQTSGSSTANTTPSNATNNAGLENASVNTVVLTELADNRAIEFIGGSGSDRVVVDNASANQFTKLDGGTNAAAGSNDSLTVVNTSVLDANDVANIKGFELLNLVENTNGNSTFNVTISEAFLLANSTTAVNLTLASVTNTYGQRLGAGDVVNLEISDLLSAGAAKASIANRVVNVQDLRAAGVTVNFQQNGVTVSTNAAPAALAANLNLTTAPAATLLDDVTGATGAALVAAVTLTAGATATGTAGVNDTFTGAYATLNGTTITGTAADTETLTITDAVAAAIGGGGGGTITNIDVLNLANVNNTAVSFGANTGISTINGGTANDTITVSDTTLNAFGNVTGAPLGSINAGAGLDTLSVAVGGFNVTDDSVTNFEVLSFTGSNTITVGASSLLDQFSIINFTGAGDITVAAGSHNISGASITSAAGTVLTINAGATLTIAGDVPLTAANTSYVGVGTLVTTGALTFDAATDTFTGTVNLAAGSAANFTDSNTTANAALVIETGDATVAKTVTLDTGAGAAVDTVRIDATGTATAAVTIANFVSGQDVLSFNTAGIGTNDVAFGATGGNISAGNGVTASNIANLYQLVTDAAGGLAATGNGGAVETAIATEALVVGASGATGITYVAIDDGVDTGIYRLTYTEGADADAILNDVNDFSVVLVARVNGLAVNFAAGDIV